MKESASFGIAIIAGIISVILATVIAISIVIVKRKAKNVQI